MPTAAPVRAFALALAFALAALAAPRPARAQAPGASQGVSPDTYAKARDAFVAGNDAQVLQLLAPGDVVQLRNKSHAMLWATISRARMGRKREALTELRDYAGLNKENPFIDRIVSLYLGKVKEDDILASEHEDWQRCEGGFYLGAYQLYFAGNESHAADLLCAAYNSGMTAFSEYQMTQSLLGKLRQTPPCLLATAAGEPATALPASAASLSTVERALLADSLGQRDHAISLYRTALKGISDPTKAGLVRSRIYTLTRESYEARAKDALRREAELSRLSGPENSIAVSRFENVSSDDNSAPLEKGIPALLASDLAQVKRLTVLERVELESLLKELSLSHSALFDTTNAPRLGHLLRAGRIVVGSFSGTGGKLDLDARVVNVRTGRVDGRVHKSGSQRDLFTLEKDLVFSLLDRMGVRPTPTERNTIEKQVPTTNLSAFLAYSRGLDEEDRGNWQRAAEQYGSAAAQDPAFHEASAAASLMSRGEVSRGDLAQALRAPEKAATASTARRVVPDKLLTRAFETERLTGSGLVPDLESGEANDRRETRPATAATGTVIITGRLP